MLGTALNSVPRALAGLSGLLLLADAYLHSTGTGNIREVLEQAAIAPFYAQALPMVWLFFSWHLLVIAVPLLWASISDPPWLLPASIFCGTVALGDFFWVYRLAGWFPGTVILLLVVAALATTSIVLVRGRASANSRLDHRT